jgi:hypothetical protein
MTLKQFFELAGGGLVGLLFYASSIPALIKWPLIIISVLAGAALAFLPLEDRPLEVWVAAFFRSIYSPTIYYWAKPIQKPKYFQDETGATPQLGVIAPQGTAQLDKYLSQGVKQKAPFSTKLEEVEQGFLTKVSGLVGQFIPRTKPQTQPQQITPPTMSASPQVPQTPAIPAEPQKKMAVRVFEEGHPITQAPVSPPVSRTATPQTQVVQAQFSPSASPPQPPTQPNTLSGQAVDASGRIIEGAILEIKDAAGRPVRAVKTNKLGHFYIVTPLADGVYEILTEKEGYEFVPVKFSAEGKLIPPIAIRANRALPNQGLGSIN